MNRARTDDAALFDEMYKDHHRVVYAYLLGQCGDAESATDLMQETFLRVWRRFADAQKVLAERRRFYFFAIARNLAIDYNRRRSVQQRFIASIETTPTAAQNDPAQTIIAQETAAAMDEAINALPADLRTVLSLHLVGGMNSVEMGEALNIPAGTVRYRLSRARKCIAEYLKRKNES